jgi:hypothetical protein
MATALVRNEFGTLQQHNENRTNTYLGNGNEVAGIFSLRLSNGSDVTDTIFYASVIVTM